MKIALVHLSDIHLRENDENNFINKKIKSIIKAINSDILHTEKVFILITGDTAFSGKNKEFEKGIDLYTEIINEIENVTKNIVLIPGNHDCDFSINSKLREKLMERTTIEDAYDDDMVNEISTPLKNFYEFDDLFKNHDKLAYSDPLFNQYKFEYEGFVIQINCLNTAWFSVRNEIPGSMLYPINKYKRNMQDIANLSITLLHHPTHWLNPVNKREVDAVLRENSDIILTGHEHESTHTKGSNLQGDETLYFEAAALQTNFPDESSFTILHLDLTKNHLSKNDFIWCPENEIYFKNDIIINEEINIAKTLKKNGFYFKSEFETWLHEPGIMIKHPRIADEILLGDIYVFQDAEILDIEDKDPSSKIINLSTLLKFNDNKVMIIGPENYGKTAFCKRYILEAFQQGYVPVLINGDRLNKTSIGEIKRSILVEFTKQYGEQKKEEFSQLEKERIILIIDDVNKSPLNAKHRIKLLNEINEHYLNVIITSSEFIKYEELLVETEKAIYKDDFTFMEMLPLGNELRGELIKTWNEIGDTGTSDEDEKIKRINRCETILRTMIGNNYVPSLPFFVLTILQTVESGDSNLKDSAYGYYYEYLIRNQLLNIRLTNEDMNTFNNYIAHLAFTFFTEKTSYMSRTELKNFHEQYKVEYAVTAEFNIFLKMLLDTSIITEFGSTFSFKYKYIYYYFAAKYLSDNLTEPEIVNRVSEMCGKLYNEEYSNIIMFLSHLSKNPVILTNVLASAKNIFKKYIPSKLDEDVQSLNKLAVNIPELVIENRNVLEERRKRHIREDEIERQRSQVIQNIEVQDDIFEFDDETEFDIVANLNWSMKTIDIMGQILKNYYGSTKKDQKIQMGEELYNLSLRSLSAFLTTFVENQDAILLDLERIINKNEVSDKAKIKDLARNFIFGLTSTISGFFIKKVSNSVGTTDLQPIFDEIQKIIPTTPVKLIDISIKLDHAYVIPFKEIEDLLDEIGDNPMVKYILRRIVVNHLYMFPVNYRDRQKVVEILSLNQKALAITTIKKQLIEK
ncbi:metallophosphoesterase [Sporosarcina sp. resist]|uniref:metallophosphoesterase n=1 Tax=Sporosarcina sp. resist TaxID=2762563 RepID=UPI00164CFC67|nr:metallophosphoesterase [Sporosarcina sp. resist]QNK89871.1 metallophosphoesterase [Sporosarcina sp. resist]